MNIITRMVTKFTGSMLLMVLLIANGAFAQNCSGNTCNPPNICCAGVCMTSEQLCTSNQHSETHGDSTGD